MINASWAHLRELHHRRDARPLSPYEATETGIHVNAYYLNLCGALDNLAWALQFEWDILPGVDEDHPKKFHCVLFGKAFQRALAEKDESLADALAEYSDWHNALRGLRDPAAHRVPIYVPPAVLDENGKQEYERLQAEAVNAANSGEWDRSFELQREAYDVGDFTPVMILSSPTGLKTVVIRRQVKHDYDRFLTVSGLVINALLPG